VGSNPIGSFSLLFIIISCEENDIMVKPICIIAARGGSKGVPKKNIRIINSKPLIAHTIIKAKKSKIFSHVIVTTEDKKIARIAKQYGAEIPFMRPKKYATDTASLDDVLVHAIKKLFSLNYKFKTVVNLDCTVPFLRIKDIVGTVNQLEKTNCNYVVGVYRQHLNPYYNIVEKNSRGFVKLVKPVKKFYRTRQESPKVYQLNGLLTFNAKTILNRNTSYSDLSKTTIYEIPIETGVMIDTEFEFEIASAMFKKWYKI
jgi:CMP-N,N'-diacetyllegionaminic acid synthase